MPQGPIPGLNYAQTPSGGTKPVQASADGELLALSAGLPYTTCAASSTTALGSAGAIGDTLTALLIVPGTTSPGAVQIKDGSGSAITVFEGGSSSVADLAPFTLELNLVSAVGGWSVITNANVTALASGTFS